MKDIKIFTDASADLHNEVAGLGWTMQSGEEEVEKHFIPIHKKTTNNQAEYLAVKAALEHLSKLPVVSLQNSITINTDSELVVRQLSGEYKVRNVELRPFYTEVKTLIEKIESMIGDAISVKHISRNYNKLADSLAREGLEIARERKSKLE